MHAYTNTNLEEWLKKWSALGGNNPITNEVAKLVDNLLVHIDRGCLSGIPPSCGTNGNENLHRRMNGHFYTGRLGTLFACA